jgi:hypothetical protein
MTIDGVVCGGVWLGVWVWGCVGVGVCGCVRLRVGVREVREQAV